MESSLQLQAQAVHARLTSQGIYSWDPITILTILQTLLACWQKNHDPDPAQARVEFERRYTKNPKRMRRRVSEHILFEAHQKGQSPSVTEVRHLTDAFIEQVLSADQTTAAQCCIEAGTLEGDEEN